MNRALIAILFGLFASFTTPRLWAGELDHCLASSLSGKFNGTYKTIEMGKHPETGQPYAEIDVEKNVKYLNDAQREKARLTIRDGRIYDSRGKLANHSDEYIYTMDGNGNFYEVTQSGLFSTRHHSTPLAGGAVGGAGMVIIRKGIPEFISNNSGHYAPPAAILKQTLEALYRQNVDLSETNIEQRLARDENPLIQNAEKYLFNHKGAASCIKETLRDPEKAKESGFRILSKVDPKGTTALIQEIEKNGDLDRYGPELAKFLKNHPEFADALSEVGREKLKSVRVPASEKLKCGPTLLGALKALLVSH